MITTIIPDKRGRVYLKQYLTDIGWAFGQGVEIDIRKVVTLPKAKKGE